MENTAAFVYFNRKIVIAQRHKIRKRKKNYTFLGQRDSQNDKFKGFTAINIFIYF